MPASLARLVELQRAVEIAVVGERQGVHAQLFGPRDQAFDRAGAVQQAVVAMAMQMNKRRRGHGGSFPRSESTRLELCNVIVILSRCGHDCHAARNFVRIRVPITVNKWYN